jgi:hypothetical protein
MAKRNIEETFQAIQPRGRRGIPNAPTIDVGVSSANGDLSSSLSQAGQQITQLQAAYQQQAELISANTQAVQGNTSAHGGSSVGSGLVGSLGSAASGLLGGGLGLLSPLISGIESLFGGKSTPAPLPFYIPPPPVAISANLSSATPNVSTNGGSASNTNQQPAATSGIAAPQPATPQQITVNVQAMDSQSIMDRSADIASAVREAMLNMHPINDVIASL